MLKKRSFHLLRFIVQVYFFFFEWVWSATEWVQESYLRIFFKPEYVRKGHCQSTGQCCRAIGIEIPVWWWNRPKLVAFIKKWHHLRYNFTFLGRHKSLLVYSCNYLTDDNKCSIHKFKPKLCRDFPKASLKGFPKLHKGCGFYFEKRVGKDFYKTLREKKSHQGTSSSPTK